MLLYRFTKLMEQHTKESGLTSAEAADWMELQELKLRLESEPTAVPLMEDDCTDWASEATY